MQRRVQSILQGGEDSPAAADGLQRDAQFYGVVLAGLINGNPDLNIHAMDNPNARDILNDINKQWIDLAIRGNQAAGSRTQSAGRQAGCRPGLDRQPDDAVQGRRAVARISANCRRSGYFPICCIGAVAAALARSCWSASLRSSWIRDQHQALPGHRRIEPAQPGSDSAPARRNGIARRRRPHGQGHGDRGHHRRDRRLGELRGRSAALAGHDDQ